MRLPRRHQARHAGPRPRRRTRLVISRLAGPRRSVRSLDSHLGRAGVRTLARTAVAAAVLISLANVAPATRLPAGPFETRPVSPSQAQLMQRFDCSPDGFGDGSTPRSAIVRSERGGLRVVSFERGWEIYTGERPHALVAVCHAPPR
jgi:hypothetical protein